MQQVEVVVVLRNEDALGLDAINEMYRIGSP
jgi:hypothetical protein